RIDDPVSAIGIGAFERDRRAALALFADDSISFVPTAQAGDDKALAGAIGVGDGFIRRGRVRLCEAFDLPVMLEDDFPRPAGELGSVLKIVSEAHSLGNNGLTRSCKAKPRPQ